MEVLQKKGSLSSRLRSMESPVCLVENVNGSLRAVPEAIHYLNGISQPVVVVAVVGLYRTGKSYLMNRLAKENRIETGFALGNTIESKTKGIWMWCVPHPTKPDHTLVLLDTEGLGDVEKGDTENDTWIFCLAVLLSSTLVYNSRGTIDNQAVEKLQYVTELMEKIKVKSPGSGLSVENEEEEEEEDTEFVKFFPSFVWAVRDFSLELKIAGKTVTEDEYLEFALQLKKGFSESVNNYNLPRLCIRNFFPSRRCFVFPYPTSPENMKYLETVKEHDLSTEFLEVTHDFCTYIFQKSCVKTVKGGYVVNGRMFGYLVRTYVETISNEDIPCLENAVVAMAQIENEAAVKEGLQVYQRGMEQVKTAFPVDIDVISTQHHQFNTQATKEFMKRSFKDENGQHLKSLVEAVNKYYSNLLLQNEKTSERKCQQLLLELCAPIATRHQEGLYTQPGGHERYSTDYKYIVDQYRSHGNKGVMAEEVLEVFLKEKSSESKSILEAETKLTEKQKTIHEENERAALLEQKIKAAQEKQRVLEKTLVYEQQIHKERLRQMREKKEEENQLLQQEFERSLECKKREQRDLLEKGFKLKADLMSQEIENLRKDNITETDRGFDKEADLTAKNIEDLKRRHSIMERDLQNVIKRRNSKTEKDFHENANPMANDMEGTNTEKVLKDEEVPKVSPLKKRAESDSILQADKFTEKQKNILEDKERATLLKQKEGADNTQEIEALCLKNSEMKICLQKKEEENKHLWKINREVEMDLQKEKEVNNNLRKNPMDMKMLLQKKEEENKHLWKINREVEMDLQKEKEVNNNLRKNPMDMEMFLQKKEEENKRLWKINREVEMDLQKEKEDNNNLRKKKMDMEMILQNKEEEIKQLRKMQNERGGNAGRRRDCFVQ